MTQQKVAFYPGWMRICIPAGRGIMMGSALASFMIVASGGNLSLMNANSFLLGAAMFLLATNGQHNFREYVRSLARLQGHNPDDIHFR